MYGTEKLACEKSGFHSTIDSSSGAMVHIASKNRAKIF